MELKHVKKSMVMMWLVLLLPIYASVALADIETISVRGAANIEGFARQTDDVTITASVLLPSGATVEPSMVRRGGSENFDSCSPNSAGGFDCQLALASQTYTGVLRVPVSLFDENNNIVDTRDAVITEESRAPTIQSVRVQEAGTDTQVIVDVLDTACLGTGCAGVCSGVSTVEVSGTGLTDIVQTVNGNPCSTTEIVTIPTAQFPTNAQISVVVTDAVGQQSAARSLQLPDILESSFEVRTSAGASIVHYGDVVIDAEIFVRISSSALDISTVQGDFSQLGGLDNQVAICNNNLDGTYDCTWQIATFLPLQNTVSVPIRASDNFGNDVSEIIQTAFTQDIVAPTLLSIDSEHSLAGSGYISGLGTDITATFSEGEIGMDPQRVTLILDGQPFTADTCTEESTGNWLCTWEGMVPDGTDTAEAFVALTSTDGAGNQITTTQTLDLIVDSTAPAVVPGSIQVQPVAGVDALIPGVIKTGDKLSVVLAVTESSSIVRSVADFSAFVTDADEVVGSCTDTNLNEFTCIWDPAALTIDVQGSITDNIHFEFEDVAGNIAQERVAVDVLGTTNFSSVDLWETSVDCSPGVFDRQTFPLINHQAFCEISLSTETDGVEIIDYSLQGCSGDVGFLEDLSFLNADSGSLHPIVSLSMKAQDAFVDELNFECEIAIRSINGNQVISVPEIETVPISFSFYNNPLGEPSDKIREKISDALDETETLEWVTKLKKLFDLASKLCNLVVEIMNIWSLFSSGVEGFTAPARDANNFNVFGPMFRALDTAACGTEGAGRTAAYEGVYKPVAKFCKFVNCQLTGEDGVPLVSDWAEFGNNALGAMGGNLIEEYGTLNPRQYMDPKENFVTAALTGCIPGILNSVNKYRQIQCLYAGCMIESVENQGPPIHACEDQKAYATCKYFYGEIFNAIPLTAFIDYALEQVKSIISDPMGLIRAGLFLLCDGICPADPAVPRLLCKGAAYLDVLGRLANELQGILNLGDFQEVQDVCEGLDDAKDRYQ